MDNPKAFLEIKRKESGYRPVYERLHDYGEINQTLGIEDRLLQAARCMDCGIPFCHWACPVGSKIPEWQDALARDDWALAYRILNSNNSFPEFTGRVCPAPCEQSCVLAIHNESVTIRENEVSIVEKAFEWGLIRPQPPQHRTKKKVAVIGSGPAGLSVADVLNKLGHQVTVFEQDNAIGGILRYGIPDFKLNKKIIDRRLHIFNQEGIVFKTNIKAGVDITTDELIKQFDAICLAVGAMQPRDLDVEGRKLQGVHFAMDYLTQQNKINAGQHIPEEERINAKDKHVLVIGGGDTGADCVGTANRQGAIRITQVEILPKPPEQRHKNNPWPYWPDVLHTSTSHQEGCERKWNLATKKFTSNNGIVKETELLQVEWQKSEQGKYQMHELTDTKLTLQSDLVLLAMGFTQPIREGLLESLILKYDTQGNIVTNKKGLCTADKFFAAGDCVTGASLVVTAIYNGRKTAFNIHKFLMCT